MPQATYTLIDTKIISSSTASITFTSISQVYKDLKIIVSATDERSGADTDDLKITINGNTSATYATRRLYGANNGIGADGGSGSWATGYNYGGVINGANAISTLFGNSEFYFYDYKSSAEKIWSTNGAATKNGPAAQITITGNRSSDTDPITSIKLEGYNSGSLRTNSTFYLYGLKNS